MQNQCRQKILQSNRLTLHLVREFYSFPSMISEKGPYVFPAYSTIPMAPRPRLNWVPGDPPKNILKLAYILYATLDLLQSVRVLYGSIP